MMNQHSSFYIQLYTQFVHPRGLTNVLKTFYIIKCLEILFLMVWFLFYLSNDSVYIVKAL